MGGYLEAELWDLLEIEIENKQESLWNQLASQVGESVHNLISECTKLEDWACRSGFFDFCISVLNLSYLQREWFVFQSLVEHCGWIFPYEKVCKVCDRPIKLSFDSGARLHAEGKPAIQFPDGYSLYAYHGVTLPEKYGNLHPHQWQAKWLLEEENAELRRVLIQGV